MSSNRDKETHLINRKTLVTSLIVIAIGLVLIIISQQTDGTSLIDKITGKKQSEKDYVEYVAMIEGKQKTIRILKKDLLFNVTMIFDKNNNFKNVDVEKKPELSDFYRQVGFADASKDVVFVYPMFTQGAYGVHGFYDYYEKNCGPECLTLPIPSKFVPIYGASASISMILPVLNYSQYY